MSNGNWTPPPPPQQQPQWGQPQQPQQQPSQSGWVDNSTVIGVWTAAQHGLQTGKHIEYVVKSKPTAKGGIWKTVTFFKPYQKKNGQAGQGFDFSFNQMKELIERINHFVNTFCEEKGYFVWQPAPPQYGNAPQQMQPQPQYGAPSYPPPQQQMQPPPVQQQAAPQQPAAAPAPVQGNMPWP